MPLQARAKDPAGELDRVVMLFHKPYGVLSQYKPVEGKRTLLEFPALAGGKAVGRLDEDSEGLLIVSSLPWVLATLTTPGCLEKVYWAQVERIPEPAALEKLARGVTLKDFTSAPARVRRLSEVDIEPRQPPIRHRLSVPTAWLELGLKEGKNRQVRRMTAAVGHPTLRLLRVSVGRFFLGDLRPGQARSATADELVDLSRLRRS